MGNTHAPVEAYPADFLQEWNDRSWKKDHTPSRAVYINLQLSAEEDKREDATKGEALGVLMKPEETTSLYIIRSNSDFKCAESIIQTLKTINWTPHTNMKDFEVLSPYTREEIRIAKGAGVGVIIVDGLDARVKLYWTKEGRIQIDFNIWPTGEESKRSLDEDMGLGYNILYVAGPQMDKQFDLLWKRPAKRGEGHVYVPGLDKGLAHFQTKQEREHLKKPKRDHQMNSPRKTTRSRSRSRSPK